MPQGGAWRALIHPDDRAIVDAAIVPQLRGDVATYECEHRMRHRDGHDVWLSSRAMVVERAADGSALRIVGTHLDISERKRTEERLALAAAMLRDSEEELRLVTDNMPALVSRLDADHRFRFANRAYGDWLRLDRPSLARPQPRRGLRRGGISHVPAAHRARARRRPRSSTSARWRRRRGRAGSR